MIICIFCEQKIGKFPDLGFWNWESEILHESSSHSQNTGSYTNLQAIAKTQEVGTNDSDVQTVAAQPNTQH